ncbi:hypothetical protein [Oleidesulfovibrio sp.]|uniref:hypothetical protein n=1 Tax=Oleidesulfovibrio sp. TaxID=2909707 RepID=UPI003A86D243
MKVLAIDKVSPDATPERVRELFMKEVHHTIKMYLADIVREIYFREDRSGTVLMLEVPSLDEARKLIDTLPMVKDGLLEYDLIPLGPFMPLALLVRDDEEPEAKTQ